VARPLCVAGAMLLIAVGSAAGCPICFTGRVVTTGQQLDAADQAVLAIAEGEQFRVIEVVKGSASAGAFIAEPVSGVDADAIRNGKPLLLLRNGLGQRWASVGSIGLEYAGWLRQVAATAHNGRDRPKAAWPQTTQTWSELTGAEWHERVALVAPFLEHPEPLAADIAHGEVARAPYSALRSLAPQLEAKTIASWIDDPKLASRRATYTLLLGIAGSSDDGARLEQRIGAAWHSRDAKNLAATLAADLELRGPSRVGWIEKMYFADADRTLPEIEAALLALSVHGGANGTVSRERVIQAYRFFIKERKPMAGFVAQELADWGYWDATTDYVALLKSNAVKDPASHFAVVSYLQRSPRPAAKAALRSLAADR
jgi:hypothetical protein